MISDREWFKKHPVALKEGFDDLRVLAPDESVAFGRTVEEYTRKLVEAREQMLWEEMKAEKRVQEAVLIAHPKWKGQIGGVTKYIVWSPYVEEDKIYMITDEDLAENMRRSFRE